MAVGSLLPNAHWSRAPCVGSYHWKTGVPPGTAEMATTMVEHHVTLARMPFDTPSRRAAVRVHVLVVESVFYRLSQMAKPA
jgi:hypothetical protein